MQNKCKVLYHPQTTLSTPEVWKNCLPPNQSLVPKRWGTTDVGDRNPIVYELKAKKKKIEDHFHALEKEMATHSSVLAWRIPGMGEPGGLPSMGSHKVGHD